MLRVALVLFITMILFGALLRSIRIPWYPSPLEVEEHFKQHEQEFEVLKDMILEDSDVDFVNAYEESPKHAMQFSRLAEYKDCLVKAGLYSVSRRNVKIEGKHYEFTEFSLYGPPYCNAEKISIAYSANLIPGDLVKVEELQRSQKERNSHEAVHRCSAIKSNWFVKYYGFGSPGSFEEHISVR